MAVCLDPAAFQRHLAERGWRQQDLAVVAGLSESVVSSAARGRPVSGPTFRRLADALAAAPVVALRDLDRLIAPPGPPPGDDSTPAARPAQGVPTGGHHHGRPAPPL